MKGDECQYEDDISLCLCDALMDNEGTVGKSTIASVWQMKANCFRLFFRVVRRVLVTLLSNDQEFFFISSMHLQHLYTCC